MIAWEYKDDGLPEVVLEGRAVSSGLAYGAVSVNARGFAAPEIYNITETQISDELAKFHLAVSATKVELEEIKDKVGEMSEGDESKIFDAHVLLLEDYTLHRKVELMLRERLVCVAYCYYAVIQGYMEALRRVEDSYLAERTSDIEDVAVRLLENLVRTSNAPPKTEISYEHILIAFDLTPSDTISMDRQKMLGFATEQGSYTSHTAILARSLGIPAVVGIPDAVLAAKGLATCILDGTNGLLILHPSRETFEKYKVIFMQRELLKQKLVSECQKETRTSDGHKITLSANVEFAHEVGPLKTAGAEGIGLYRTEFYLLEQEHIPDEDEQAYLYSSVVEEVGEDDLTIFRTLDSGGDKLSGEPLLKPEPNPFLGRRGIRYSLARPEIFKVQLRALLRATPFGKVGIMFPMVSQIAEVYRAKKLLQECHDELVAEGYNISDDYQVGVMIEVPAAALLAEEIAKHVDFFSIGTNDLVQYTTAVDRVNELVSYLYRPADPGVLRLMKMTVEGGRKSNIWTGVCGEMASDVELLPILVGLGVEELSVGVNKVPIVKGALRRLNYSECQQLIQEAFTMTRAQDIVKASRAIAERAYPELLEHECS